MSDQEAEDALNKALVESEQRNILRNKLSAQLEESGWREQVKVQVRRKVAVCLLRTSGIGSKEASIKVCGSLSSN